MANHFCVFACGGVTTYELCQRECPYGDSVRCTIDIVMFGELALCVVTHVWFLYCVCKLVGALLWMCSLVLLVCVFACLDSCVMTLGQHKHACYVIITRN